MSYRAAPARENEKKPSIAKDPSIPAHILELQTAMEVVRGSHGGVMPKDFDFSQLKPMLKEPASHAFADDIMQALHSYRNAHGGQDPKSPAELEPLLKNPATIKDLRTMMNQ
ncbi:MAG: hypothetical protein QM760_21970 [Nibricoccus sp.]